MATLKVGTHEREVVTRTVVASTVLYIEYDRLSYNYDQADMAEVLKVSNDEWRSADGAVCIGRQGERGQVVVVSDDDYFDEGDDYLFQFSKDAAEAFIEMSEAPGKETRASVGGRRILRLASKSSYLIGKAPCGAYFRITRAQAKKIGETVVKEFYSPAAVTPLRTRRKRS